MTVHSRPTQYYILKSCQKSARNLYTLEEKRNRQDLIEIFKISQEKSIIGLHDLFTLDKSNKGDKR